MDEEKSSRTPVEELRNARAMTLEQLADHLGCSKTHAADLCTGRRPVTARLARRLETISERPWWEWVTGPEAAESASDVVKKVQAA